MNIEMFRQDILMLFVGKKMEEFVSFCEKNSLNYKINSYNNRGRPSNAFSSPSTIYVDLKGDTKEPDRNSIVTHAS